MMKKKYFEIPTEEVLWENKKNRIANSSDEELHNFYEKVNYNIKHFPDPSLKEMFLKEKELVIIQFKTRGIKIPKITDRMLYCYVKENDLINNLSQKTAVQREFLYQMEKLKKK